MLSIPYVYDYFTGSERTVGRYLRKYLINMKTIAL